MKLNIANHVNGVLIRRTGNRKQLEELKDQMSIYVGWFPGVYPEVDNFSEYSRSYLTVRLVWYTPCAVKYERLGRFFNISSGPQFHLPPLGAVMC
jgi:hypothetical protein